MQNAALAMGGVPDYDAAESYNGVSWATENNMTCCGFQFAAAGDLDGALAMGLYPDRQKTSEFNGTTWANGTSQPVATRLGVGGGSQNAAWVYGQHPSTTATLHWNGSAWSSHATIGLAGNQYGGGVGSIGAALSTRQKDTYVYDGLTWGKTNNRNSEIFDSATAGQQDAAVAMGGRNPSDTTCTEEYNGSSWVQSCAVPVANGRHGGLGGPKSRSDAALSMVLYHFLYIHIQHQIDILL
jgi:hypothetical protein